MVMKWIMVMVFVLKCNGFLLESNTQTPQSGTLIDEKYNTLMDLLIAERRSRKDLEAAVTLELLALKQEVSRCQCNHVNVAFSQNETEKLKTEMLQLQKERKLLQIKLNQLEQANYALSVKVQKLEHDLSMIQAPPNVTNGKQLVEEIQRTSNQLNTITNEVNARKQDFMALYQKVVATEDRLENVSTTLQKEQNKTFTTLHQDILNSSKDTTGKVRILEARQNETDIKLQKQTDKLQQSLDTARNRAIVTTCNYASAVNDVMMFTFIKTINGINNDTSIRNSGIFTCEKPGLYIVSVFMLSDTAGGIFYVRKNEQPIAVAHIPTPKNYATSSATVVTQLAIGDTIKVTGSLHVLIGYDSCLYIIQIQ